VAENCSDDPLDESKSLRNNALWFPDIPEGHLQLNETYFSGIYNPASEFEPLFYTIFRDATHPRHLVRISVIWDLAYISAIDFHYSLGSSSRFGRLYEPGSPDEIMSYDIDGPGGEVIKKIKISRRKTTDAVSSEPGGLDSFQVSVHLIILDILVYTVAYLYLVLY
jgi:hypothetical protein